MARVLVTGMSGAGKSTVMRELAGRGHAAIDLDAPEWSEWVEADPSDTLTPRTGQDWVWRTERVRALLEGHRNGVLFVSGTAQNMGEVMPLIDVVVLLSAPVATIMERLAARPFGEHGHTDEDQRATVELIDTVEPLLRQVARREIDTRSPLNSVVDEVLQVARELEPPLNR